MKTRQLLLRRRPVSFAHPLLRLLLLSNLLLATPLCGRAQCFSDRSDYSTGAQPRYLALGDMNGDGRLDIVTASDNSRTVTVLLAQATGGYAGQDYNIGRPSSVAVGDVNGDGRLDIVIPTSSNVTVLLALATGGYTSQTYSGGGDDVALGDINKDGLLDIVVVNLNGSSVRVLLAQATGNNTDQSYSLGNNPFAVALGDVNADGRLDIVTANFQNNVTILLGQATGGFGSPQNYEVGNLPVKVTTADLNGDGRADIVTANSTSGTVTVLLAQTTGDFTRQDYTVGTRPRGVAVGDLNADGRLDIVTANDALNNVVLLLAQPIGGYARTNYAVGGSPQKVALEDLNADGRLDIVTANLGGNSVTVLGSSIPAAITQQPVSGSTVCIGTTVTAFVSTTGIVTGYQWYQNGSVVSGQTSATLTLPNATTANSGSYSVVVTGSCNSLTSTAFNLTVDPLPVVAITGLASAYCKDASAVTLTGSPAGGTFTVNGTPANQVVPPNLAPGSYTVVYSYTNSNGCSATTSQTVTINALPTVSIVPSALSGCAGQIITLSALGADRYVWNTGATTTSIPVTATGTMVYSVTGTISTGCSASASQSITIYPLPSAPGLLTQQGQGYPGGQASVTVDLNSGNVNLVASGCNGTLTWSGPNGTSGSSSPIMVSTSQPGRFVYMATCTTNGCTSPVSSATVTVRGRLTVLHRDVDNYATNNAIQPLLQLQNQGSSALLLSAITLRYYVTVEGGGGLSNLSVNYAQVGNQNVRLRYVALNPAQQGASGYVEVSFTAGAGSLAAGANSGAIQTYFAKGDYGSLNETDDYSYNPVRDQLTATQRITAYYNGVLIAGVEPGSTATVRAVRALTESRNGPSATQISTVLEVRNEGTVAINYSDLSARYYFTSDGNERLQVEVDEGNVSAQLVALSQPVAGTNYYLEIRYNQGGQLVPGASTGAIRYRISKPDGGRFNQANDYSYQEQPQERSQNSRVVVLVNNEVVWGTPPTGSNARLATNQEPGTELQVRVLGNPVRSDHVSVQIKGAGGEPLQLQLVSAQGRIITQQQIAVPQAVEQHDLSLVGQGPGVFLLQVSTPTQTRMVRILKAE